jgi:glutamate N-acetyltransferase / amino-acid N-acetyltransferase
MKKTFLPLPLGFLASGVHAGLKKSQKPDLALLCSTLPAVTVGLVTTNRVKAAPARHTEKSLKSGAPIQAILVNTRCANALTGRQGEKDVRATVQFVSKLLNISEKAVLTHSTGTIGVPLPLEKILSGARQAALRLSRGGGMDAANAILTTDTFSKVSARPFFVGGKGAWLTGIAKGSGMIHPNMATMLVYLLTDAAVSRNLLKKALAEAVAGSFHRITVDGDVSTNDSVLLLANGACGNKPLTSRGQDYRELVKVLKEVCLDLAKLVIRDGEGATKFVSITLQGAASDQDALAAAMAVAKSPLVKTALFGADPNWGRVLAAVGYSGAAVSEWKAKVLIGGYRLYDGGKKVNWSREKLKKILSQKDVEITVDLRMGKAKTTVYTCDLSDGYIDINGRYTT